MEAIFSILPDDASWDYLFCDQQLSAYGWNYSSISKN